jgi:glycosyltransferase involved in cell wall biosynthesis
METSFPSKLTEYAQYGKPLVIWGPSYCSAIKWGKEGARALCVEDPDPLAVVAAVERLRSSPAEYERLSARARHAANTEFFPELLQQKFVSALEDAIELHRVNERGDRHR